MMTTSKPPTNPFVGPRPFVRDEKLYGRTRETRQLFYLLTAERIAWLHSPSGAGKTSLIEASLIPRLEKDGFEVYPTIRVNLEFPTLQPRPSEKSVNRFLLSTIMSLEEDLPADERYSDDGLAELDLSSYLTKRLPPKEPGANVVLIFDQFEEILTIDPLQLDKKREFFQELGRALLNDAIWSMFSLREEFLAQLEPYIDYIPTRWSNTFRLELLGEKAVHEVVKKTARHGGRTFSDPAAELLFTDLAMTKVQQPDGSFIDQPGNFVEPVQLQVVCRRLWDEMAADDEVIDEDDMRDFGDVSTALGAYYTEKITRIADGDVGLERRIREWFGKRLITSSGIRGQVPKGEGKSGNLENDVIKELLDTHLIRGEKRAGATWYELAHDRLIPPVADQNEVWKTAHLQPFQQRAAQWVEQGSPVDGGIFLLYGRDLWCALRYQKSNPVLVTSDENALLEISKKAFKRMTLYGLSGVLFLSFVIYFFVQTDLAKEKAIAQSRKLQRLLAKSEWNNGFDELNAENGNKLAGLHYLSKAADRFAVLDDYENYRNARLALKQVNIQPLSGIMQHDNAVDGAVFSADGSRILSWNDDKVRLWDGSSGEPLTEPMRHDGEVTGALFSEDGSRILSWSDNTVRLWDGSSGEPLTEPMRHDNSARGALFSADGSRILSWNDDTVRLWDGSSGEPLTEPMRHDGEVTGALFSEDGSRILSWSDNTVRLWDGSSGEPLTEPIHHDDWSSVTGVTGALLNEDGSRILSWSHDTVRLWDGSSGEPLTEPIYHNDWSSVTGVTGALFNGDGSRILSWSHDTVRLWDGSSGEPLTEPKPHGGNVYGALFNEDGSRILSWSDNTVRLWDGSSGEPLTEPMRHDGTITGALFSEDGSRILSWSDKTVRFWDGSSGEPLTEPMLHDNSVRGALFSEDGSRILSWSYDKTVRLWDGSIGEPLTEPMRHDGEVTGALFSEDGSRILSWSDKTVRLWDGSSGEPLTEPMPHDDWVMGALFSEDGSRILSWSDKTVRLWDGSSGEPLTEPMPHDDWVRGALFSEDGSRILSWSDKTVRLWDGSSGEPLMEPIRQEGTITGAVFNEDGSRILSWSYDKTVRLWDGSSGEPLTEPMRQEGAINGAVFNEDGSRILSWSDWVVRLWDGSSGEPLTEPMRHDGTITGALFSEDGSRILSWSYDKTVRLWDGSSGEPLTEPMRHDGTINGAVFNEDGSRILSWSYDKTVRLWDGSNGEPLTEPMRHDGTIIGAVFSDDGSRILSWSEDRMVRLWDISIDKSWPEDKIVLRSEITTGTRLTETGILKVLSATEWQEKRWCEYDKILFDLKRISNQQWKISQRLCNELREKNAETEKKRRMKQ